MWVDIAISSKRLLLKAEHHTVSILKSFQEKWLRLFPSEEPRWPLISFSALLVFELLVLHSILSRDTRPPQWDPSSHLYVALDFYFPLHKFQLDRFFKQLLFRPKAYPPLFHLCAALWYLVTGPSHQYAAMVNGFFLLVAYIGFYLFGRELRLRDRGFLSAVIFSAFPIVIWMSREALIDLALVAFTLLFAATTFSDGFLRDAKATRRSGLAFSLGFLSKQSFLFFAIPIFLYRLVQAKRANDRTVWKKNLLCFSRWAALSIVWYVLQLSSMLQTAQRINQAAVAKSDPLPFSWAGSSYYLRMLWLSQANGWILLILGLGILLAFTPVRRGEKMTTRRTFFLVWLLGGYAIVTFLMINKDGRYDMPMVPALILLAGIGINRLPRFVWRGVAVAIPLLFVGTVGYMLGGSFQRSTDGAFSANRSMVWLFQSPGIGREVIEPRDENWQVEQLVDELVSQRGKKARISLGVIPQAQFFNPGTFRYFAKVRETSFQIEDFSLITDAASPLAKLDYLVRKTGDQGPEYATRPNEAIQAYLDAHPADFRLISSVSLPDGSRADLLEMTSRK
jgi:4-amino-4-deoxy-L-arabinose transferase-like glycosyltransferase